ncbi:MAG: transglycosylase domain-containing protein [Pseudomonadota bacterium]
MMASVKPKSLVMALAIAGAGVIALTALALSNAIQPTPSTLKAALGEGEKSQIRDRFGTPLSYTFATRWNYSDYVPLHLIPPTLVKAFIEAEDKRFYAHSGVDWLARAHAVWQNIVALRTVRGASTISEQVTRMIAPVRSRSVWTRLIEGFEATALERRFSKAEILEFYLNQIPYAAQRRGVSQAARYYWNRDLSTLTTWEELALAVMVRAPDRLNLYRSPLAIDSSVGRLAAKLIKGGALDPSDYENSSRNRAPLAKPEIPVRADHFARFMLSQSTDRQLLGVQTTTIDPAIQRSAQEILEGIIRDLSNYNVKDGAMLVLDTKTGEVLAWVNAFDPKNSEAGEIDGVITPRQPGSTLKPLLYALAIERGWSAATIINDSPLAEPVGLGLHNYRNFSRRYYGDITLREALGNSLNIPAIKAVQFVGKDELLKFLRELNFTSLTKPVEHYGEGLALGNGEVTLLELVSSYLMLASRGVQRPLVTRLYTPSRDGSTHRRAISSPTASIISDILSDPQARSHEFGGDGLLNFPIQTAIKTGTSTDFKDAWAIAYSSNFTIGVWMGNQDRSSMSSITGSRGPALALRAAFAEFERTRESAPLFIDPLLTRVSICPETGKRPNAGCRSKLELFTTVGAPQEICDSPHPINTEEQDQIKHREARNGTDAAMISIVLPTPGLNLALDPRIPDQLEAFRFKVKATQRFESLEWIVDNSVVGRTDGDDLTYLWNLQGGHHTLKVRATSKTPPYQVTTSEVEFLVR